MEKDSKEPKKEKKDTKKDQKLSNIAVAILAIIIIGALLFYLVATYYPDILENLGGPEEKKIQTIEYGDLADVHYIGRYTSNNTIFDSSYDYPENKTGGTPTKIYLTDNSSAIPPSGYSGYSNLINGEYVEGFIEGLVGLKTLEIKTMDPIPPEEGYGVSPTLGDIIDFSSLGEDIKLKIVEIKENQPLPEEYLEIKDMYGLPNITTIYVLRYETHFIGENIDLYFEDDFGVVPLWENATTITKINETLLWTYTTPDNSKLENITWVDTNLDIGYRTIYPTNSSSVTFINETIFKVTHSPEINDTIMFYNNSFPYGLTYVIEEVTADKIITYVQEETNTTNKTYREFDRIQTVNRNITQEITVSFPAEIFQFYLDFLRQGDPLCNYRLDSLADESVYFEVEIVDVYKID